MKITRIQGAEPNFVANAVSTALKQAGYSNYAGTKDHSVNISDIRLSPSYVEKYGRNIFAYSGRRGNVLGWVNWVEVNNTINRVLDKMNVSANVHSLHGQLKVREGMHSFTEKDWEAFGQRNVGSMMSPIRAMDAWSPENPEKVRKKLGELW